MDQVIVESFTLDHTKSKSTLCPKLQADYHTKGGSDHEY